MYLSMYLSIFIFICVCVCVVVSDTEHKLSPKAAKESLNKADMKRYERDTMRIMYDNIAAIKEEATAQTSKVAGDAALVSSIELAASTRVKEAKQAASERNCIVDVAPHYPSVKKQKKKKLLEVLSFLPFVSSILFCSTALLFSVSVSVSVSAFVRLPFAFS